MADVLDYAPPPPKQPSPIHRIFASVMAVGLLVFIVLGYFGVVGNPTADDGGWGFHIVLPVLSLLAVLFLAAQIFLLLNPPHKRARQLLDTYRRIYSAEPDWQPVDLRQVPRLNAGFLSAVRRQFEAEGLHHLGDLENAGLRRVEPNQRIGMRVMIDPAGISIATLFAGHYRLSIRLLLFLTRKRGGYRYAGQQTYLSDGRILVTHFPNPNSARPQPWCVSFEIPWDAGVAALVLRHRTELAAYLAAHPGAEALPCPTPEILIARLNEEARRVKLLYEETGFLTPDDLRRMWGPNSTAARQLVPALEQILYQEHKQAQAADPPPPDSAR